MFRFYKNLIFTIFWVSYFLLYFSPDYVLLENYFAQKFDYSDIVFSYLTACIWFFTTIWVVWLINRAFEKIFKNIFSEKSTILFLIDFIIKFIAVSKYVLAFYVLSYFAILPETIKGIVNTTYSIMIIIIVLFFATSFVNKFFTEDLIKQSKLKALSRTLLPFINKAIIVFIWIIWIITIFDNLGYDITALVAWAWIWGLAIAFAAQKSIWNIFGTITILLNKPFKIWDFVTVNWITWTVKDIWLSYLTIRDKLWHQVMIPNEAIISTNVENFSVRDNRRTDFSIGLIYGTTLKKMERWVWIIEEILEEYIEKETISSYRVNFDMFGDFSLNIQVTYFSLINDSYKEYLKQKEEINLEIKKRFKLDKIEMAFPTQELIIKK